MSFFAAASSSSRLARPSSIESAFVLSPDFFARATMSSACSRASLSRARYSSSSSSASSRVCAAASMSELIFEARSSSISRIRGKAAFESTHIVNRKAMTVQIISPSSGVTRKEPPESPPLSAPVRTTPLMSLTISTTA